jgi:hypothetical protein
MKYWGIRWKAMMNLRLYDHIASEVEKLNLQDIQNLCYEQYQDIFPGRKGSMLTLEILILYAKLPSYKGNHYESIHRLYKILYPSKPFDFYPSDQDKDIVTIQVCNILCRIPDFSLALSVLSALVKKNPNNVDYLSAVGRLQLQVGNIESAWTTFQRVSCV